MAVALLHPALREAITRFDPTVHVLWNNRISRWVVACTGNDVVPIDPALIGCPEVVGAMTRFSPIFVCEMALTDADDPGDGMPVEPGPWMLEKLAELRERKGLTKEEYRRRVAEEDAEKERRKLAPIEERNASMREEMRRYGGGDNYDGRGMNRRHHVTITGNPLAKG